MSPLIESHLLRRLGDLLLHMLLCPLSAQQHPDDLQPETITGTSPNISARVSQENVATDGLLNMLKAICYARA